MTPDLFGSDRSATISPCGTYRYRLDRGIGDRLVAFLMVNPSTADAEFDDATIRKVRGFARRIGYQRFAVGNLFAYRATDIGALRDCPDPVGPENDLHLTALIAEAELVVVAWGPKAKLPTRLRSRWPIVPEMARTAGKRLHCLGTAADGQPLHPLMLAYSSPLMEWRTPNP